MLLFVHSSCCGHIHSMFANEFFNFSTFLLVLFIIFLTFFCCCPIVIFIFSFPIALQLKSNWNWMGHNGEMESYLDTVHGLLDIFGAFMVVIKWFPIRIIFFIRVLLLDEFDWMGVFESKFVDLARWDGQGEGVGERRRERECKFSRQFGHLGKQVPSAVSGIVCTQITILICIHEKSHSHFPAAI